MLKNCFCSVMLAGVNLTSFGFMVPSPFVSLQMSNSEVASMTSFTLTCQVGGDDRRKINIAAFEALIYSAAQQSTDNGTGGIPVSFQFGWLDEKVTSVNTFLIKDSVSNSKYLQLDCL